jgi:hypothetical protein
MSPTPAPPRSGSSPLLALSALLTLGLLGALALPACSEAEPSGCVVAADCAEGQVCTGGVCVEDTTNTCRSLRDCRNGEICEDNVCVPAPDVGDVSEEPDTADASDAGSDRGADSAPEVVEEPQVFDEPPVVVSTDPEAGESGVPIDAAVSVTFDQPMRSTSFTPTNVRIEDWRGNPLSRAISYDDETWTVTLSPPDAAEYFTPSSPYHLILERNIRGDNDLNLAERVEITFFTAPYDDEGYRALAEAYAPVIYAEVRPSEGPRLDARIDWFTRVDFDDDLDLSNNYANARNSQPLEAVGYYAVLETETHYLLQYVFYYPLGLDDDDADYTAAVAHDFAYIMVVVQKLADDPLGRFVMAEGLGDGQLWGFALNDYPDPESECGGDAEPPCGGVSVVNDTVMVTFDPALLEIGGDDDPVGRRYPAFFTDATHASCLLSHAGEARLPNPNRCFHPVGGDSPFSEDNRASSRVLRFGAEPSTWGSGEETGEITYGLESFLDVFWAQRANEDFYEGSLDYDTPTDDSDGAVPVPGRLVADPASAGIASNPSRTPPFLVQPDIVRTCTDCSIRGVWFVDPIFELTSHVSFDHDVSTVYCFNPYRGIDIRGTGLCR